MNARYCILLHLLCIALQIYPHAITFQKNPGRLGDQILNYCKHKWLAHKYNLDLYVPDFTYKQCFALNQLEKSEKQLDRDKYMHNVKIKADTDIRPRRDQDMLYVGHYYLMINSIADQSKWADHLFGLTIVDAVFGNKIQNMLRLRVELSDIALPSNCISVAMHIRKGGGFDKPLASVQYKDQIDGSSKIKKGSQFADRSQPFKFPPEQFYLDQLCNLYEYLNKQDLCVYVFTDDKNPQAIVDRLQERVPYKNIQFNWRPSGNAHNKNVIEDIYAMSQCDYLIRSKSHYPWIAQMMGQHKGIIYPVSYSWKGALLHFTKSHLDLPDREQHSITRIIYNS